MPEQTSAAAMLVIIGAYAPARSEGIHVYRMDPASGALTRLSAVSGLENPSFLAVHPNRRFLYAVSEVGQFAGRPGGAVAAFSLNPRTGALAPLNQQSSRGAGPCYVSVSADRAGDVVLVANYGGGSVALLPIQNDGRLGEATDFVQHQGSSVNPGRQEGPHAHSILPDPANRFAFAADLGLDKVLIYRLDPGRGTLVPNDQAWASVKAGAGTRYSAFHPGGRYAYVINELDSTVTAFAYDAARGALREVQTLPTLPAGFSGSNSCADIHVAPSGRFLYGSNRGHDSIALFGIDGRSGKLRAVGHEPTQGKTPRNFALDPTGTFLLAANQDTDNVVIFRINKRTGGLTPTGQTLRVSKPVCVQVLPAEA